MKNLFFFSFMFCSSLVLTAGVIAVDKTPSIETALSQPVLMLYRWPDDSSLNGPKAIDSERKIVIAPKNQSWKWIRSVFHESWLPPNRTHMHFMHKEFDERDVTRIAWPHNNYRIEVAQTASIFTMKIIAPGTNDFGCDSNQRFENARQICSQVFNEKGKMWSQDANGAGSVIVVPDLSSKICDFSFDVAKAKQLQGNKGVIGQAKSMKDEGIHFPPGREGSGWEAMDSNIKSRGAWCYWFRNVNWWNDGKSIGFYFLKTDGPGTGIFSFGGEIDKNWFHVPKDRLGRPISAR